VAQRVIAVVYDALNSRGADEDKARAAATLSQVNLRSNLVSTRWTAASTRSTIASKIEDRLDRLETRLDRLEHG
jgi:hypothetical protein